MQERWLTVVFVLSSLLLPLGCASSASSEASKAATAPAAPGAAYEYEAEVDSDGTLVSEDATAALRQAAPEGNALGAPPPPPQVAPDEGEPVPGNDQQQVETPTSEQRAPLLIYQATLTMSVFEAKQRIDEVEALAKKTGGYLLTRSDQLITIRVPAAKFNDTLEAIAKTGDELHREVSARDVTEQFNDLDIRLKNAEAMRERLVTLLAKANSVKDALAVEEQLERVALDIESIKGKLKRLRELIAFSTITVRFEARPVDKVDSEVNLPFPWLSDLGLVRLLDL